MNTDVTSKLRVLGGASTIALTFGLAPAAFAQAAPEGCNEDNGTVVCSPNVDPDGFTSAADGVTLTVEIDSVVQGEINLGFDSNVTVDGEVVVTNGQSALDLGASATVVNNGRLEANPFIDAVLSVEGDSVVTNNGEIISEDAFLVAGINAEANSTVVNNGVIELDGDQVGGIVSGLTTEQTGVTVTNTGRISIDTRPDGVGAGILINDGATVTNEGVIETRGDNAPAILVANDVFVTNSGTITTTGRGSSAITTETNAVVVNEADGSISTLGTSAFGVLVGADSSVENAGSITTQGGNASGVRLGDNSTLVNSGSITTAGQGAEIIVGAANNTITNSGTIQSTGNFARGIELGEGFTLTNSGDISTVGRAVTTTDNADITNSGTISAVEEEGIQLVSGTITNEAGGSISGTVGVAVVAGSTDPLTLANFGAINGSAADADTGRVDAVLFGDGDDEFQQWTGATTNGWVDLGMGDDTFILEGSSSSITGSVDGGEGTDSAILAGTLDSDNLVGFEAFQLGSTLGGTLNDLVISGNRTLDGDVVHSGEVTVGLGVDSLTATGSITLEDTGVLTITTPLDQELIGQDVLVFADGTGFVNNGATVNIVDDDLLLEYTPVVGSLRVNVAATDPLAGADVDPNVGAFAGAVTAGVNNGTIAEATFDTFNTLPDAAAYEQTLADALPVLNEGVAREIFESGNLSAAALDRHLIAGGSGVWGQIAVRGADQDAVSALVDGYESDQTVFTVGGDMAASENLSFGLMLSYADIEIDNETAGGALTGSSEVESLRLGAYVAGTFSERGFVNVDLSYLTGDVDSTRNGLAGSVGSSYDFDGFAGRVVVGYDVLGGEGVSLTPTIGLNATTLSFDDALENGVFGFAVEREDADFLEARLGAELSGDLSDSLSAFVQGTYIHDLAGDARNLTLTSTQLPSFTVTSPSREENRFELAAGAAFDVSENFAIELGYLGDFNSGYSAHAGRANVRIKF